MKSQRMQMIQNLAMQKEEASIRAFGQCMDKLNRMQNQLQKLYQYRDEYSQQFNHHASQGVQSRDVQTFLKFINSLSHNIDNLLKSIEAQRKNCEQLKQDWLEKRKTVQIFDTVKNKYLKQEQIEQHRREQIQSDELSLGFFLRKHS